MSNTYFRFKQFIIHQDKCGMKVSTDACIQGAWTPILPHVKRALDIGTGTGLLSLMLAQRNSDIHIDTIELDEAAALQAKENIAASPWADRINVIQGDVRTYSFTAPYDMIICNPPFFHKSLQSDDEARNNARHTTQLTHDELIILFGKLLEQDGYAAVLLPALNHEVFEKSLKINRFDIFNKLFIIPKAGNEPNRVVIMCSKAGLQECELHHLPIRTAENAYNQHFISLLEPFYL